MKVEILNNPKEPKRFVIDLQGFDGRASVLLNMKLDPEPRLEDMISQAVESFTLILKHKIRIAIISHVEK